LKQFLKQHTHTLHSLKKRSLRQVILPFHRTLAVIMTSIIIKPVSITLSFLLLACCCELGYSYFFRFGVLLVCWCLCNSFYSRYRVFTLGDALILVSGCFAPSPCHPIRRPKLRGPNLNYVAPISELWHPNIEVVPPQLNLFD